MIPLSERTVIAGKYQLVQELANGGMGAVWVARHLALEADVAIKFISPTLPEAANARLRFAREAQAAARVRGPHVVQVLDHGVDGDIPYLVMELLEGEHLGARLRRQGRLSPSAAATVCDHVAKALSRAHRVGIVHRDIKPANLFLARLDDEEIVKVLDFGIAKILDGSSAEVTRSDMLMGSPQYMSPEQARGSNNVDHRADLFSLGAILFRCLTGVLAFDGASAVDVIVRICTGPTPLPSQAMAGLPQEADAFFLRALDRDPDRRFQSAMELHAVFSELMQRLEASAMAPMPVITPLQVIEPRTRISHPTAVGLGPLSELREDAPVKPSMDAVRAVSLFSMDPPTARTPVAVGPSASRRQAFMQPDQHEIDDFIERAFDALLRRDGGPASDASETTRRPDARACIPAPAPSDLSRSGERNIAGPRVAWLIGEGFTALRRGEHDAARRMWREALEADPRNRQLATNLRRLEMQPRTKLVPG